MSDFTIQNFYYDQKVNQDNMNGTFTSPGQQIAAFFPKIPNVSNGIGNISNNYGQIGTTNQFNFANGVFQFPKQIGPIGSTLEYTSATYTSTGTKTITVPTDGDIYYIVAELSTAIIDPGQYSTSVTILTTAMTLTAVNADTNKFLPICAIVGNAGVYTVSLDNNCAYNYGANNNIQSDFNRIKNLGSATTYTLALTDAFSLICNNGVSIAYSLPAYTTFPVGTTFCIKNQTGAINNGIYSIPMTAGQSNDYHKCEVGNNGWIVDGQPIAAYSQWLSLKTFTQNLNATSGWTKLPNGLVLQWGIRTTNSSGIITVAFPTPFINLAFAVGFASFVSGAIVHTFSSIDRNGMVVNSFSSSTGAPLGGQSFTFIVVGI